MYKGVHLQKEEKNAIIKLEEIISKPIPASNSLFAENGFIAEGERVIALNLSFCNLETLPAPIMHLINLRELNLEENKLKSLPEWLGIFVKLEKLSCAVNKLTTLPESLKNLVTLKRLNLAHNQFDILPETFGELPRLERLILQNARLTKLPTNFGNLKSLVHLNLAYNKLPSLPQSLSELENLQSLSVKSAHLSTLPNDFGSLGSLSLLDLSINKLTSLPDSFGSLKNLKTLDLSRNQLTQLPLSFPKLSSLEKVSLAHNKLQELPENIGNLLHLQKLDFTHNLLTYLPNSICNLTQLRELILINNNLLELPANIWRLKSLERLRIKGNPLSKDTEFLSDRDCKTILEFYWKRNTIHVFLSHAIEDFEKYQLNEIVKNLESRDDIYIVHHCERDMHKNGHIDRFMNTTIPQSHVLLFIASQNSMQGKDCLHELDLAKRNNLLIIPLLADIDEANPILRDLKVDSEMGFELSIKNLTTLCERIYQKICEYRDHHDLFYSRNDNKDIIPQILSIFRQYIAITKTRAKLIERIEDLEILLEKRNEKTITDVDFMNEFLSIIL